jgi:hypothetical protein
MYEKLKIERVSWLEVAIGIGFIIYGIIVTKIFVF